MADDEGKQLLLAQFMEVVGESAEQSRQFLEATNWELEEAIQLFFAGGIEARSAAARAPPSTEEEHPVLPNPELPAAVVDSDFVRPPLPVKREALYEDIFEYNRARRSQPSALQPVPVDAFRNFDEEYRIAGSSAGAKVPTLASMFRPPVELNFEGNFEQAKALAAKQGKWLLVNLQSHREFASHMLNRDTWAHEAVKDTVRTTFVFSQIYDDTEEGTKVCTYYRLNTVPTILVLDPLTGQKMRAWEGMVGAERLLEDLVQFMDKGPMEQGFNTRPKDVEQQVKAKPGDVEEDEELKKALAASMEGISSEPEAMKQEAADTKSRVKYPELPAEPRADEPQICRVGVRFPDGRRGQRRYLRSDPLSYLWSYCCLNVEAAANGKRFRLTHTIPGVKGSLEYDPSVTMGEAGVANSMLVMVWD